jgi:XTP/dITP diphosphohydrolase
VEGTIAPRPAGTGGFGYDPIFFYPPLGRTLAEVSPEQKDAVSHRGVAFRELRAFLLNRLGAPASGPLEPDRR